MHFATALQFALCGLAAAWVPTPTLSTRHCPSRSPLSKLRANPNDEESGRPQTFKNAAATLAIAAAVAFNPTPDALNGAGDYFSLQGHAASYDLKTSSLDKMAAKRGGGATGGKRAAATVKAADVVAPQKVAAAGGEVKGKRLTPAQAKRLAREEEEVS